MVKLSDICQVNKNNILLDFVLTETVKISIKKIILKNSHKKVAKKKKKEQEQDLLDNSSLLGGLGA